MGDDFQPVVILRHPPPGRVRFSGEEVRHILVAFGALVLAFTLLSSGGLGALREPLRMAALLPVVAVSIGLGFLLHEFAHKIMAQRYGCWAEFRYYPLGLAFTVLGALVGFIFAAPGAVFIRGQVTRGRMGRIGAAGPLANFVIALAALPLLWSPAGALALSTAWMNILLGGFNLIPFPPFDGEKVFRWNPAIWGAMVAAALGLYLLEESLALGARALLKTSPG